MLKILNSYGAFGSKKVEHMQAIESLNSNGLDIEVINHREELEIEKAYSPYDLDKLYRQKDNRLIAFYENVYNICQGKDVIIVDHENVFHPEFIVQLSKIVYTVLYSGDDPESSYYCSQPYAWAFDHVFCYSVYYDKNVRMSDKMIQWGAKRANLRPYGYLENRYDAKVSYEQLFLAERDIDVIYIGSPHAKSERLLKLKKEFKERFKLYGHWGGVRSFISRIKWHRQIVSIRPLASELIIPTYQRAKIGVNMHMSYGPSNRRMWELPINGVMQITDNPKGTSELFHVGEEIICYENNNIESLIEHIHYYLKNDSERIDIAKAGYKKVVNNYSYISQFMKALNTIIIGMSNKASSRSNIDY